MKVDTQPLRRRVHRLPREQRTADIMEMARTVFCEKGYSEAVISEIAQRLGVVEGTIYRYFPSKRDLLIDVASDWYEQMLSDYDQQLQGVRGTWNRLRFMVWRHLTVIHDDPAMCRLVMGELRVLPEYRKTPVYELNRAYTQRTTAIIEEGMASGEFRSEVPLQIVRDMIYGGVEHHTWAYLRGVGDFSPDEAADSIVDLIYRGLANTESATDDAQSNGQAIHRLEKVTKRLERLAKSPEAS
jgi:TetR/AcrR family transcriptional regulator, fatty acid metabolism regulator protein